MFQDYKTSEDRLPPKTDHTATIIALIVGIILAWVLIEFIITPEALLNYAETL